MSLPDAFPDIARIDNYFIVDAPIPTEDLFFIFFNELMIGITENSKIYILFIQLMRYNGTLNIKK